MSIVQFEDNKGYTYYFNGLLIYSEIRLPEIELKDVVRKDYPRRVTITLGVVPDEISNAVYKNPAMSIGHAEVLVNIEGVAAYHIKGGSEVIIQACEGVKEPTIALYILSIVLGVLLHQNDILALHATAIKVGDGAVIIAGNSGVGKSTLALGLYKKGYEVINDDISSVYFNNNGLPYVWPGVSALKLWALSLEAYGYLPDAFEKIRDEIYKYSFPVKRHHVDALPVKAVFFIHEHAEKRLEKQAIESGLGKIKKIKANTYRYKLVQHLQKANIHFSQAAKLSSSVPFFNVSRSPVVSPAEFADYMEQQFTTL
jgi:hypothetical protein